MVVQLLCPNLACRKFLNVPGDLRGTTIRCQCCNTEFRVPDSKKTDKAVLPPAPMIGKGR